MPKKRPRWGARPSSKVKNRLLFNESYIRFNCRGGEFVHPTRGIFGGLENDLGGFLALNADVETPVGVFYALALEVVVNHGSVGVNVNFNRFNTAGCIELVDFGKLEGAGFGFVGGSKGGVEFTGFNVLDLVAKEVVFA